MTSLFDGTFKAVATGNIDLEALIKLTIRAVGGKFKIGHEKFRLLPKEYIKSIINHDIYRLEGINRSSAKMQLLLQSLARNESTTASIATLKKDISDFDNDTLDNDTISTYLSTFERLFLIENQKAFSSNIRSSTRIKQSEKRHFVDPSLAIAILEANLRIY